MLLSCVWQWRVSIAQHLLLLPAQKDAQTSHKNTIGAFIFYPFQKELWCHLALFFDIAACWQEDSVARETAAKVHGAAAHSKAGKCLLAPGASTETAPGKDAMQAVLRQAPPLPGSVLTPHPLAHRGQWGGTAPIYLDYYFS